MSYVLIIGAKSDIAKATAREYANHGYDLYLAARNSNELEEFANDIRVRTLRSVKLFEFDILDYESHQKFYHNLNEKPLGVVSAVGYLGDHEKALSDLNEAKKIIDVNYTGVLSILNIIAADFENRQSGFIIGISSVAGDRGRKRNYIYGSAKAALTAYLSGLRNRLYEANVNVITIKPGFVATKMTEGLDLPEKLTAQPKDVAKDIYKAFRKGKDVLYVKWVWKFIMIIIRNIPEFQFKKMNI